MTWSAVGTWHGSNNANLTLSNQAAGNLLVVEVLNFSNSTVWCTGLTGGGATWTQAGVKFSGTTNAFSAAVFLGKVTSTGGQTATPTWSGTAPASFSLAGQEFHSTIGAWSFDKQGNLDSAATGNWVSLTPSFGAGELYFGFAACLTTAANGTPTSGYVYNVSVDGVNNGAAYNVNCPGSATFPVWSDGEQSLGIMILVAETISVPAPPVPLPLRPPGWFPGSDQATAVPGGIPFAPLPGTTDAAPAVVIPPTPEPAPYKPPPLPPNWFPGSAAVTQDPGGIPFYSEPQPADPSLAILPPPAPDILGIAEWLPLPPNWFPGSNSVTTDPGSIPFYSLPQPQTPPPAPAPLPVITGQSGTGLAAYFRDQNGSPRLYVSAETWGLPANAGRWNGGNWRGDYDSYHATRFAQGYTANLTHPWGHTHTGCNNDLGHTWDGIFPFLVDGAAADLTGQGGTITLNDPFWQRIDYMFASAAGVGMTVFLDMSMSNDMPTGAGHGFTNGVFQNASTSQIQTASQRVAERYAATPNLVWFFGDDYYNDDDTNYNAMWTGISAADPRIASCTAIEYYPTGNTSRYDLSGPPGGETPHGWGNTHATYSFVYCYMQVYFGVEYAYTEPSPLGPVVWGDGMFWGNGGTSGQNDQLQRNNAWWALASGARGFVAEDETVLQWGSTALASMTADGLFQATIRNIAALFTGLPGWHKLIPDTGSALVTAGRGTRAVYSGSEYLANTDNYVAASRVPDGSLAVIYCAQAMSITIDQTKMGAGYTATWADPASGALTATGTGSTYSSSGLGTNSAGGSDWVLILQGPAITAPSQGLPDWQPQPPGWFPGADRVTDLPGGIPFYVVPQPTDQVAAQAPVTTTATAALAGAGAVAALVTEAPIATAAGAGAVAAVVTEAPIAALAGAGAVAALVTEIAGASLAGAGAVTDVATQAVTASLAGAGSVTDVVTQAVIASLTGAGALTANVAGAGSTANLAGAGAVTALATVAATAAAAGAGAVAATVTQRGSAALSGAGALTAAGQITGTANLTAAGAVSAKAAQAVTAQATGAGALAALATQAVTASLAGAGALAATASSAASIVNATSAPAVTARGTSAATVTGRVSGGPAVTSKASSSPAVSDG